MQRHQMAVVQHVREMMDELAVFICAFSLLQVKSIWGTSQRYYHLKFDTAGEWTMVSQCLVSMNIFLMFLMYCSFDGYLKVNYNGTIICEWNSTYTLNWMPNFDHQNENIVTIGMILGYDLNETNIRYQTFRTNLLSVGITEYLSKYAIQGQKKRHHIYQVTMHQFITHIYEYGSQIKLSKFSLVIYVWCIHYLCLHILSISFRNKIFDSLVMNYNL